MSPFLLVEVVAHMTSLVKEILHPHVFLWCLWFPWWCFVLLVAAHLGDSWPLRSSSSLLVVVRNWRSDPNKRDLSTFLAPGLTLNPQKFWRNQSFYVCFLFLTRQCEKVQSSALRGERRPSPYVKKPSSLLSNIAKPVLNVFQPHCGNLFPLSCPAQTKGMPWASKRKWQIAKRQKNKTYSYFT